MFYPEPKHINKKDISNIAVILINLGTPDAPTPRAVRRYLKEFLSDRRVIEIPPLIWQFILRIFILPFRSHQSAKKYRSIWQKKGSPLKVITEQQVTLLQEKFKKANHPIKVMYAFRYGQPNIQSILNALHQQGTQRIILMPMYPQYASATTATANDQVFQFMRHLRNQFDVRMVRSYPTHTAYIDALVHRVETFWQQNGRPDFQNGERLVLSFHGLPERTKQLGDPYYEECVATAQALREALRLKEAECLISFQSRFGAEKWLQPYTEATIRELAQQGAKRVDVFCPGFTADCLETLEEVAIELHEVFLKEGGECFNAIPCLNDDPIWIDAIKQIVDEQLFFWGGTAPTEAWLFPHLVEHEQ